MITGKSYDLEGKSYTYTKREVLPEFEGGDAELMRFIQRSVKYPWKEQSDDIQGKVIVRFTLEKTGKVTDAKVIHSVSPGLDKEALRVVNMLPDFTPGKQRGQPVIVYYNIPVIYKLSD